MLNSEIQTLLDTFLPIGLDEMNEAILMNRVETKYVFSAKKLPYLLNRLSGNYKVLEINMMRAAPYRTTYLDTADLLFYTQQVRGKLNRYKIRYRIYESTGLSFLEIKEKTNKNRTIKSRIENSLNTNLPDEDASAFIKGYFSYSFSDLSPVLINEFTRITLVEPGLKERITLDYNISFSSPEGSSWRLPFLAIAELKRERHSGQASLGTVMKHIGIHSGSFSKYCIGSVLTREMPHKNILKPNLLLINKIENEYAMSNGA